MSPSVRHIFRWDLDKTYLRTEFDTVGPPETHDIEYDPYEAAPKAAPDGDTEPTEDGGD